MKGPLLYDTIDPVPFERWSGQLFKNELNNRSSARVAKDQEFKYIVEDKALVQKRLDANRISLNIDKRKTEIDEEKARKDQRKADRAKAVPSGEKRFTITLDNVAKPELEPYAEKKEAKPLAARLEEDDDADDDEAEGPGKPVDAIRNETINVLSDLVQLSHGPKTAQAVPVTK